MHFIYCFSPLYILFLLLLLPILSHLTNTRSHLGIIGTIGAVYTLAMEAKAKTIHLQGVNTSGTRESNEVTTTGAEFAKSDQLLGVKDMAR